MSSRHTQDATIFSKDHKAVSNIHWNDTINFIRYHKERRGESQVLESIYNKQMVREQCKEQRRINRAYQNCRADGMAEERAKIHGINTKIIQKRRFCILEIHRQQEASIFRQCGVFSDNRGDFLGRNQQTLI